MQEPALWVTVGRRKAGFAPGVEPAADGAGDDVADGAGDGTRLGPSDGDGVGAGAAAVAAGEELPAGAADAETAAVAWGEGVPAGRGAAGAAAAVWGDGRGGRVGAGLAPDVEGPAAHAPKRIAIAAINGDAGRRVACTDRMVELHQPTVRVPASYVWTQSLGRQAAVRGSALRPGRC
jgi:hypothetical protein